MLKLTSVHSSYGNIEALKGIDIDLNEGEIVSLIGSNGAGKTTTLMTISGIIRPHKGDIIFENESIKNKSPHDIVKMGICQVPEGRRIFPKLTVLENLEMGAYTINMKSKSKFRDNLEKVFHLFPILKERSNQLGGTLSGGEQQMLAIARALMSNPKLLLLDEPSLGLAPIMVNRIFKILKEINKLNVTILLVEQNAKAALMLSNRGYVMEGGKIIISGKSEDLLNNMDVKKAYLGE